MALEIQETVSLDNSNVQDELKELIPSLLGNGIRVFYDPNSAITQTANFVYLERGGNIAHLYYVPSGYAVAFPIKPSRDVGFGIAMIDYGDRDKDHTTLDIQEALEACDRALQSEMENWLNGKTYPNYGHEGIPVPVVEITEI